MSISVDCPDCGKQYRQIRPELAGKKARCTCGATMLLGPPKDAAGEKDSNTEPPAVDLSTADVFENSYGDLESILASAGPAGPLSDSVTDAIVPELPREVARNRAANKNKSTQQTGTRRNDRSPSPRPASSAVAASQPDSDSEPTGNRVRTISFLAAIVSATLAFWSSLLIVVSRFRVIDNRLIDSTSQVLHDISRGTSGEFEVSKSSEQIFTMLGWSLAIVAGALIVFAVAQLISAYGRMFWQKPLIFGSDGITATLAVVLLFLLVGMMFVHMSHISQLGRTLVENAAVGLNDNSAVAQNVRELKDRYAQLGSHFLFHTIGLAIAPLLVFVLSMVRLITLPDE